MYPPKFDLRHFMQHLAPGGYYFFQIALFAMFCLWLIDPSAFVENIKKINRINQTALVFGFLATGVVCYFIGVVIRLPSVDEIDSISAENGLREMLWKIIVKTQSERGFLRLLRFLLIYLKWKALQNWFYVSTRKKSLTVEQTIILLNLGNNKKLKDGLGGDFLIGFCNEILADLNNLNKTEAEIYKEYCKTLNRCPSLQTIIGDEAINISINKELHVFLDSLKKALDYDNPYSSIRFHDWYIKIAGKRIKRIQSTKSTSDTADCAFIENPPSWLTQGLWATDCFPYPLWLIYEIYLHDCPERHKEFKENLEPILLASMRNDPETSLRNHAPFNRCKLFILSRSPELASDVYDREALVRMMAGFYRGLSLGKYIAMLMLSFSLTVWCGIPLGSTSISSKAIPYLALISILLFFFNWTYLKRLENSFRHLRLSESEAVFHSYIIALSQPKSGLISGRGAP